MRQSRQLRSWLGKRCSPARYTTMRKTKCFWHSAAKSNQRFLGARAAQLHPLSCRSVPTTACWHTGWISPSFGFGIPILQNAEMHKREATSMLLRPSLSIKRRLTRATGSRKRRTFFLQHRGAQRMHCAGRNASNARVGRETMGANTCVAGAYRARTHASYGWLRGLSLVFGLAGSNPALLTFKRNSFKVPAGKRYAAVTFASSTVEMRSRQKGPG